MAISEQAPTLDEEPDVLSLCADCIGDAFLRGEIISGGVHARCFHCGDTRPAMAVEEVANWVEAAFEKHFQLTPTEPSAMESVAIREGDYDWDREGEPAAIVIAELLGVEEEIASEVQSLLECRHDDFELAAMGVETPYQESAHYEQRAADVSVFGEQWRGFETGLKMRARHFNSEAEAVLADLPRDQRQVQRLR